MTENVPEGWYPNTAPGAAPQTEMYWDGSQWQTDRVRTASPVAVETTPESSGPVREKKPRNIPGLLALIAGALGFVFACVPGAFIIGWILLPVAFILGIVALFQQDKPKGMGIAGLILSVVGTVVGFAVFIGFGVAAIDDAIEDSSKETVSSSEAATDEEEEPAEEEPTVADPKDLVLGETVFGTDSDGRGWYAVQITNPNEDYVFASAGIDVEAYDADGVLIDTDSSYSAILQGESWYVGNFFDIGSSKIDRIEVRGPSADASTHSLLADTGSFTIGEITTSSEYDWMTVSGTVTSNFSEDQDAVRIDVIARNGDGEIVGVDYTYTDRVPAGGTAKWDVSYWEVPLDSKVTAYPHL